MEFISFMKEKRVVELFAVEDKSFLGKEVKLIEVRWVKIVYLFSSFISHIL